MLDLARMRRDRIARLHSTMAQAEVDVLLLCGQQNVSYATGARVPAADHVRAAWWRSVAVLRADEPWPHLYTDFVEGVPPEYPPEFVHPAIEVEAREGSAQLVGRAPGRNARARRRPLPVVGRARGPRADRCGDGARAGQGVQDR